MIHFHNKINRFKFEQMTDLVAHRGPDDRGFFYENNIALGHRRLAVIDPSKEGHQPFLYGERYVLVYNGEIYNYQELRTDLEKLGYIFQTKTDTEVLAAAYAHYGKECVHHFNGMWAFAIYDRKEQTIFCSRDRYGIKPFYYYTDQNMFLFCSEIKQILSVLEIQPRVNKNRLLEFLICGDSDFSTETMFQDIFQLKGGSNITISLKNYKFELEKYYEISTIRQTWMHNFEDSASEFYNLFQQSVSYRLRADVPVGYCLSGGLDSTAIACMANRIIKEEGMQNIQKAISSCSKYPAYDEQEYIDEVIRFTKIKSQKVFPNINSLFKDLDTIIWHMDEPLGSTSIYAQWAVFQEAKNQGLTVMLDGQGADELLAGYSPFYGVWFCELIKQGHFKKLITEVTKYVHERAATEKHFNYRAVIINAIGSLIFSQETRNKVRRILKIDMNGKEWFPFAEEDIQLVLDHRSYYPTENAQQYMLDGLNYGLQALLHYEDRNSMAHSIESRIPFLDYRLVESLLSMPLSYKIGDGRTKKILREGLKDILPEKVRNRTTKLGFVTPEDQWINKNPILFRTQIEKACETLPGILDKSIVLPWYDRNIGKITRGNFVIFRIICTGRWAEIFHVKE